MATPFSFHCIICFDEFNHDDQYPVVLPCGHTYVCNVCADRLERCMECRETLYAPPARATTCNTTDQAPRVSSFSVAARSGRRANLERPRSMTLDSRSKSSDKGPSKVRLPLPKNLVLLSLMEASDVSKHNVFASMFANGEDDRRETTDGEEERIRISTKVTAGLCGTYAVGTKQQLRIVSKIPAPDTGESRNDETDYKAQIMGEIHYMDEKPMILNYGDR